MVKYLVAPARLPDALTWFKWEAYTTWLSGMGLLALVYYLQAELFMIDATVMDLAPWLAVAISRSEEHTSELQSLMRISYAVFCLNKTKIITNISTTDKNQPQ